MSTSRDFCVRGDICGLLEVVASVLRAMVMLLMPRSIVRASIGGKVIVPLLNIRYVAKNDADCKCWFSWSQTNIIDDLRAVLSTNEITVALSNQVWA